MSPESHTRFKPGDRVSVRSYPGHVAVVVEVLDHCLTQGCTKLALKVERVPGSFPSWPDNIGHWHEEDAEIYEDVITRDHGVVVDVAWYAEAVVALGIGVENINMNATEARQLADVLQLAADVAEGHAAPPGGGPRVS